MYVAFFYWDAKYIPQLKLM